MKKNLVMLLCAVSLLAHTVQAESAPVTPGEVAAAQKTKALESGFKRNMRKVRHSVGGFFAPAGNYLGRTYGGPAKSNWFGVRDNKGSIYNSFAGREMGPMTESQHKEAMDAVSANRYRHLTGRVPYGVSHASRLVNALLLADVLGHDTNSFIGRGLGNVGRRLGFHRKAKDWRRGAYNAMTNGKWYGRGGRALAALALAGLSDAALARMVGDSSAIGASYRGIRGLFPSRTGYAGGGKYADATGADYDDNAEGVVSAMDQLEANLEAEAKAAEDKAAEAKAAEDLAAEIARFKDLPKGHGGLWTSSDRRALLAAQGALSPKAREALSKAGELRN